jgi:hypothetical protein
VADELVFRSWFRRPTMRTFNEVPHRRPRQRFFPPQQHVDEKTASFESAVAFASGAPTAPFASTVAFASEFGTPGLFVTDESAVLFKSRFSVTGGDLASPRYRR